MTPYTKVYDAFQARILDDEWTNWTEEEMYQDMRQILESALPWFKFPRVSKDRDDTGFLEDWSADEIQILATYMKCEWLNRSIMTWENIKPLYTERDFSQANLLDKLTKSLQNERNQAKSYESDYYRSVNGKPFSYRNLAGNGN